MLFDFISPIVEASIDREELTRLLKKYSIMPYYGTNESSSHSMLQLLHDLAEVCPSHNACKVDVYKYTFGSSLDIVRRPEPGFADDFEQEQLERAEKLAFIKWLRSIGITMIQIHGLLKDLASSLDDSGNAYLAIRIDYFGNKPIVTLKQWDFRYAAYLATKPLESPWIVCTTKWDEQYWRDNPPSLYTASELHKPFNWRQLRRGKTYETIVHFHTNRKPNAVYGRPAILSAMNWMYTEYMLGDLAGKTSGTEFVSKYVFLFEEIDPKRFAGTPTEKDAAFKIRMNELRTLTTVEGHQPKGFAGLDYPFKGNKPELLKLDVNRDTKHLQFLSDTAAAEIYQLWQWDRQLTGFSLAHANLGGNIIIDAFTTRNISTVEPRQAYWENAFAHIFQQIADVVAPRQEVHTIQCPNLIDRLVEALAKQSGSTTPISQVGRSNSPVKAGNLEDNTSEEDE